MFLLLATSMPSGQVFAQGLPPHKDPRAEKSEFSALAMLGYFASVMILLGQGEYNDVSSLLDQLAHAGIPEDLRFIIERYAELLGALGDGLEATERSLDRAQIFLDRGDRAAARQQLEAASSSLSQARRGLEDLQLATDTMARRLGVFGVPAGSSASAVRPYQPYCSPLLGAPVCQYELDVKWENDGWS